MALGVAVPSNVEFIAKWGEGLYWFKSTDTDSLVLYQNSQRIRKAVIINLGVNDLNNGRAYVTYMKKVAANLKKYNCKMYYLSVNPVNSAMIKSVEEKQDQKLRLHHLTEPFTKICVQERINHLRILIPAQTFR